MKIGKQYLVLFIITDLIMLTVVYYIYIYIYIYLLKFISLTNIIN